MAQAKGDPALARSLRLVLAGTDGGTWLAAEVEKRSRTVLRWVPPLSFGIRWCSEDRAVAEIGRSHRTGTFGSALGIVIFRRTPPQVGMAVRHGKPCHFRGTRGRRGENERGEAVSGRTRDVLRQDHAEVAASSARRVCRWPSHDLGPRGRARPGGARHRGGRTRWSWNGRLARPVGGSLRQRGSGDPAPDQVPHHEDRRLGSSSSLP